MSKVTLGNFQSFTNLMAETAMAAPAKRRLLVVVSQPRRPRRRPAAARLPEPRTITPEELSQPLRVPRTSVTL